MDEIYKCHKIRIFILTNLDKNKLREKIIKVSLLFSFKWEFG